MRAHDAFGEYDRGALSIAIRQLGELLGAQASRVKHYLHQGYYPDFLPAFGLRRRQILHEMHGFDPVFHKLSADMVRLVYKLEQKIVADAASQGGGTGLMALTALRERQKLIDLLLRGSHRKLAQFRQNQITAKPTIDTNGLYVLCGELEKLALFIQYLAIGIKFSDTGLLAFKLGENFAERLLASLPDLRLLELDWSLVQNYLELGENQTPTWIEAEIVGDRAESGSGSGSADAEPSEPSPPLTAHLRPAAGVYSPSSGKSSPLYPQNAPPAATKRSQELRRRVFPYR
ncbi:MAG: hypothetical protein QM537_08750 [Candidatus Symbiobacter sp.]|nr:hypothetical protein [Candidatus Symbiobacter sp.]